jgi:hypothetical protein
MGEPIQFKYGFQWIQSTYPIREISQQSLSGLLTRLIPSGL